MISVGILNTCTSLSAPCPAGHFCPLLSNKALPCVPGTYRGEFSSVTHKCTLCPKPLSLQGGRKTGAKSISDCFTGEAWPLLWFCAIR